MKYEPVVKVAKQIVPAVMTLLCGLFLVMYGLAASGLLPADFVLRLLG